MPKLHCIGIGGIGVSAVARYYHSRGWTVTGSDRSDSHLIERLRGEGMRVGIGESPDHLDPDTDLVIYSEAIITKPDLSAEENLRANVELARARSLGMETQSYPEALAAVTREHRLIAVAGSHGKSTTTAMIGCVLQDPSVDGSTIVGTQVPAFGGMNAHLGQGDLFVIEACEYKRSFLRYHPAFTLITNIDLDHRDYYRDADDYLSAFQSLADQTSEYVIFSVNDPESSRLRDPSRRQVWVSCDRYEVSDTGHSEMIPTMTLRVPGEHLAYDARLAFVACRMVGIPSERIVSALESYEGAWRRSETIRTTPHGNTLMSDYGHHPTEIRATLRALHDRYIDQKLFVVFQPHQYSRTRELLADFATAFDDADTVVVPDIYFSRDKQEDVEYMTRERFVATLQARYPSAIDGGGLDHTRVIIEEYDHTHPDSSIILLLGAGDVDDLRYSLFSR